MKKTKDKLIGIIGGMGPMAGVHLQRLIVETTSAHTDQGHIKFLYLMNPHIPSRQGSTKRYYESLLHSIRLLEKAGVTHIAIACYSAYIGAYKLRKSMKAKLIDIPGLTVRWISNNFFTKPLGLLAAPAVIKSGLFQKPLESKGLRVIIPSDQVQKECVEKAIYHPKFGIKSGHIEQPGRLIKEAIRHLERKGAQKIIIGCTDLSIIFPFSNSKLIDPFRITAGQIVHMAGKKTA